MVLLHWCTISPEGPSGLAAIRFTAPIRVSSIRVFPDGAQPFANSPEIIAETQPEAFFVDIYFNAHPLNPSSIPDSKDKQRAPNALVPSVIAYAGGLLDFTVDMGTEYATRLMIVKGKFERLSMAIYGDVVSETLPAALSYTPGVLPVVETTPLSQPLDPSRSLDPSQLARQLLLLIPDSPPLSLVIRLMFCLKPSNDDWDLPDFPICILIWTQKLKRNQTLTALANKVAESIGPKNADQAYDVAKLLGISASQNPDMIRTLLKHLEITSIFDSDLLEHTTILRLLEATSNVDIAQYFNNETFFTMLRDIQQSTSSDGGTQLAARRLEDRIYGWKVFEEALSNPTGDFRGAAIFLKQIGSEEQSFGVWLESMIIHEGIYTKLSTTPTMSTFKSPILLLRESQDVVSHDDFISFVRAYIGVASVLAVWAWTDSLGNDECRERALAILRLWQGVDGYRDIVNHLLLLRQLTRRLGWITTDNDPPRKSGMLAEQVIMDLAFEPQAILREDMISTILSLKSPLSAIAEGDRLSMRKVALVAEDGLPSAIEELIFSSDHPLSLRRLRTLRVSLAIIQRELKHDKGEWEILQALWEEKSHGIITQLVGILVGVAEDINNHFIIDLAPAMNHTLVDQLFVPLTIFYDLSSNCLQEQFSSCTSAYASAQKAQQSCLDLLRYLSAPDYRADPGKPGAEVILRALLEHSRESRGKDPVYHLHQLLVLLEYVIPDPEVVDEEEDWVISILPNLINEFRSFCCLLDAEKQAHLVGQLVKLDNQIIGIGEWLLLEELKLLSDTLQSLTNHLSTSEHRLVKENQAFVSLHFIYELAKPSSNVSAWCISALVTNQDISALLSACLIALANERCTSLYLTQTLHYLIAAKPKFEPDLALAILVALLQAAHGKPTLVAADILYIIQTQPPVNPIPTVLPLQIGRTLSVFAQQSSKLDTKTSEVLFGLIEWFSRIEARPLLLPGITSKSISRLYDSITPNLTDQETEILGAIRANITLDEDESPGSAPMELAERLHISIQDIDDILHPDVPMPSTPKGTTPDILGVVISPPTALLRSPAATGLTKTYANNDFRELRQIPSARQNTSRLPSMHGMNRSRLEYTV
ncbi:hypothetical protein BD779DRAFT_1667776 [Infundibulicybe gibba]|nr:hypothetical protein BD779DRAFT_1667776 [Infundibulicybe gibba]